MIPWLAVISGSGIIMCTWYGITAGAILCGFVPYRSTPRMSSQRLPVSALLQTQLPDVPLLPDVPEPEALLPDVP